jgi:YbbR domain-containing protein
MPFQDVEDEPVQVPRTPSAVERWLRKIFVEDFGLKLLSLVITLFLWAAVTGENQPMTTHAAVPLNYVKPDNLAISNDPPRTVEVLLTGSRNKLNNLRLLDLVATIDLSDSKTGDRVIRLSPEKVTIPLPQGVTVASFQPATLAVRLEPVVRREVPVEVRLEGKVADGWEVYGVQPTPAAVWVSGPASHVESLQKVPTETISVEGRRESFLIARVSIAVADEKLEIGDGLVDVAVSIGEQRVERSFENVTILRSDKSGSSTATITLAGPKQMIDQLKSNEIKVVVDRSTSGEIISRLQLPAEKQRDIKLVTVNPPLSK